MHPSLKLNLAFFTNCSVHLHYLNVQAHDQPDFIPLIMAIPVIDRSSDSGKLSTFSHSFFPAVTDQHFSYSAHGWLSPLDRDRYEKCENTLRVQAHMAELFSRWNWIFPAATFHIVQWKSEIFHHVFERCSLFFCFCSSLTFALLDLEFSFFFFFCSLILCFRSSVSFSPNTQKHTHCHRGVFPHFDYFKNECSPVPVLQAWKLIRW